MKVTLHIGSGKTGTSSIQHFLANNFDQLLRDSILYSMFLTYDGSHEILKPLGTQKINRLSDDTVIARIETLNKIINSHQIKQLIWSLESLFYDKVENINILKNTLAYDQIEIIVFIKRQDLFFKSAFYQWGRKHKTYHGNYLISFDDFIEKYKYMGDYERFIGRWAEVFGKENIKIQPFEKAQLPNGLIHKFCEMSGLNIDDYTYDNLFRNQTFDHFTNEFIGLYNSQFSEKHYDADLVAMISNRIDHKKRKENFKEYGVLSEDIQNKIIDTYKEINGRIAREYLLRNDGVLFYEPITAIDSQIIKDIDYNKLFQIVIEILLNQEKEIKNLKQRMF